MSVISNSHHLELRHTIAVIMFAICMSNLGAVSAVEENDNFYIVLCYHSIPERYQGDPMSISVARFVEQIEWLREQGYTAINLDQVLAAKTGKAKLPSKSYLITFDDGYEDFYTHVFPLLTLFKLPAVMAVVGKWIEEGVPSKNETDPHFRKQRFLSWAQIKEMTDSGLVEIASHSYDLHHGILGNPQGNSQPAAVTLQYDSNHNRYENINQRRARIHADLENNSRIIEEHLGVRPRTMVWPYGAYDRIALEESARVGMTINLTLDTGRASVENTEIIPRILVNKEMPLSTFSYLTQQTFLRHHTEPVHALKVLLDRLYNKDADQQDANLGILLEQVRTLGLNAVVLQPYVTPGPSGLIENVYFPNSIAPMRADMLNRVAWQLKSRLGVKVYVLVPLSNLSQTENGKQRPLNLVVEQDRQILFKFYEELRSHVPSHGIIFARTPFSSVASDIRPELTRQIRAYFYSPIERRDRDMSSIEHHAEYGWNFQVTDQNYPFAIINFPQDLSSDEVKEFIQNLPSQHVTWLSLSVTNLSSDRMRMVMQSIRLLQARGINHFVLDDDGFLDEPYKIDSVRSVLSLKSNPYVEVGQ